jgi:adhesin/invasin
MSSLKISAVQESYSSAMYFRPMRKTLLLLALLSVASQAKAQGYRGRDFWVAFPQNAILEGNKTLSMSLVICAESRTVGDISNGQDSTHVHFNVEAGAYIEVPLDTMLEMRSSGQIERRSVHVIGDHDISLYVLTHRPASTDSYMAIPTPLLGTDYIVAGYHQLINGPQGFATQCLIIATEDNTLVAVKLTADTRDGQPAGRTLSIPMMRGETFQLQGVMVYSQNGDLTGTIISSNKPIAMFTGHKCAQIPAEISFCDILVESEPPASAWGRDYILTSFFKKEYFIARIVARDDSTDITVGTHHIARLNRGEFVELDTLWKDIGLHCSKPVLVAQYSTGSDADTFSRESPFHVGDPFMLLAVPSDRFVSEVTAVTMVSNAFNHYLNVVVPDSGVESLEIDDALVRFNKFPSRVALERTNHMPTMHATIYTFEVPPGRHTIRSKAPIAVYSYGFGGGQENYDSYGHTCGMRLDATR